MSADGEDDGAEGLGLLATKPGGLSGLITQNALVPGGGLIQPNALAALAGGLPRRPIPLPRGSSLGLIPTGHRTLKEVHRELVRRLYPQIPLEDGADNHWDTVHRICVLEIGNALRTGDLEGLVFDVPTRTVFRVPQYCWAPLYWDLTAEDDSWVGGDFEDSILRDTLFGRNMGAYSERTVFLCERHLESWLLKVVRRYDEEAKAAAVERAEGVQARKAKARGEAERQIRAAMMQSPEEQPADWKKDEARRRLTADIEGLTDHGFDRAWSAALTAAPECRWSAGGRPPKTGNRNPGRKKR